eukprot:5354091-Pyramimonas_sp.AAC.1
MELRWRYPRALPVPGRQEQCGHAVAALVARPLERAGCSPRVPALAIEVDIAALRRLPRASVSFARFGNTK